MRARAGRPGRARITVGVAAGLCLLAALSARAGEVAARGRCRPPERAVASDMIDDAVTASEARALEQLHDALAAAASPAATQGTAPGGVEPLVRRHKGLVRRWLLGDDGRVALGYERCALLDQLMWSRDPALRALAAEALAARPGLGYCMRALPPPAHAARLASVVRELGIVESLRREAASLLLSEGTPAEAARAHAQSVARVERLVGEHQDVARRWLLDETDAGIFDTYRAEIVRALGASTLAPLHRLAAEVAERRARLASTARPAGTS
jgi:hypothetical protein